MEKAFSLGLQQTYYLRSLAMFLLLIDGAIPKSCKVYLSPCQTSGFYPQTVRPLLPCHASGPAASDRCDLKADELPV